MNLTGKGGEREVVMSHRRQSEAQVVAILRAAGLRPTRPRLALARHLFGEGGNRHVNADALYRALGQGRDGMSLATIYNTLHAFADAGLLRAIEGAGDRTVFDTNTRQHHHFHLEGSDEVFDIPEGAMCFARTPVAPDGMVIVDVQVIVRLKRQDPAQH